MSVILGKINLSKVDKSKFYVSKKGEKFLDILLLENKEGEDDYGNTHFICQGVSKEEREAGVKGPILGNAKVVGEKKPKYASDTFGNRKSHPTQQDDDTPF